MSLSRQRKEFLAALFAEIDSDPKPLSDWEKSFMADQKTRFDRYGADMFLSAKQMGVIQRVAELYPELPPEDPGEDE